MLDKFFREVRGRFELTQSQAIGSVFLVLLIFIFVAAPILYRYIVLKPQTVNVPMVETKKKKSAPHKSREQRKVERKKKQKPHTKTHMIVPVLQSGQEVMLPNANKPPVITRINLNTADTALLKTVKGIGDSYAQRIVRYRELLGGFISYKQLDKVYNLPEEAKQNLILRLDSTVLKPYRFIDINHDSFKELLAHPFLDYEAVKKVVNYRNQTFFYTNSDAFKTGLDSSVVKDLLPYVKIIN